MKKIKIGTRGSKLALAYTAKVLNLLIENNANLKDENFEIIKIKTSGDINQSSKLSTIGGKQLFCKELEESLLTNKIDVAIHSLKDLEKIDHSNLIVGSYIKRNDPREILLSDKEFSISDTNLTIATCSNRRKFQLQKLNHNINIIDIRGNIDTRLNKMQNQFCDALMLANAGVSTLKLKTAFKKMFEIDEVVPSAGQGVIALQCKKDNYDILDLIKSINDAQTEKCAKAEKIALEVIGGDCNTAVGIHAELKTINEIKIIGELFSSDGSKSVKESITGKVDSFSSLGKELGLKLINELKK